MGIWQGDVSLSYERDLEGIGRWKIFDTLASLVWFAVVGVVGEAGVETIVMAGRRETGAGRTTGAAGTWTGVWMGGEGRMGVGACTGWTIGAGCVDAGTGVWMGAWKGGRTSARTGEVGRSDSHWDSDLCPRCLNLRVQVPHESISPRRLRIWDGAGVSGWYAFCDRGMAG